MLQSMTGYGSVVVESGNLIIRIEIRSLNSKYLDLGIRVPRQFSEKEITLRPPLSQRLQRGKVNLSIDIEYINGLQMKRTINKPLLLSYLKEVRETAAEAGISADNVLPALLNINDILQLPAAEPDLKDWADVEPVLELALTEFENFRNKEGQTLEIEIRQYVNNIEEALKRLQPWKDGRMQKVKDNLREKLRQLIDEEHIDENRLEQELLYYSDKFDISEEMVRLQSHIALFYKTLEEPAPGKKIGFVVQEMGREINTIGSKSNDGDMQKEVVVMKEELEKIKEQAFNIV
jgi:uncharacterized protein (TIGR00255 family)